MLFTAAEEQNHIVEFMRDHAIATLATADAKGVPHAATIFVTFDEHTKDFFFITRKGTQKADNLSQNAHAALALYEARSQSTVQVQGTVTPETDQQRIDAIFHAAVKASRETQADNVPPVTQLAAGEYVAFRLKPTALHMATYSSHDPGNPSHKKHRTLLD